MDLLSIIRMMFRRWMVVMPVLSLTFGAVIYMMATRATDYSMSGSYVLVSDEQLSPLRTQLEPEAAADALRSQFLQQSVKQQVIDEGLSGDYAVTVSNTGTSMEIVIRADTADVVLATAIRLVDLAPDLLQDAYGESSATISVRSLTDFADNTNVSAEGEGAEQHFVVRVALLLSRESSDSVNPFPANLATVRSLTRSADSIGFANRVQANTSLTSYAVTGEVREAPILDITVTASSDQAARTGYAYVRDAIVDALGRLQDENSVNERYRTLIRHVVEPVELKVNPASVIRPVAGIVILGGGLAVALAALVETILFSGRLRGLSRAAGSDSPPIDMSTNGSGTNGSGTRGSGTRGRARRTRRGDADVGASAIERDVDQLV